MANPGYGKRSAPQQLPRTRQDFALLPTRERYVAGFVDHLPEGASMSVKQLAKQLPLYGQQAISTALNALSVAGHLRRVRCSVTNASGETRWAFRTFWSRTAHDNEWWNTYLATENSSSAANADSAPPPPWVPVEDTVPPPAPEEPRTEQAPEATGVPQQRTPDQAPDTAPAKPCAVEAGPAYLALARLGRDDHRLALSADDCAVLEALATQWLDRGVSVDYLTSALTAGLPAQVDSPLGLLRRRLTDKMPPRLPATESPSPGSPAPARRILMECTDCGRPGQPEALPDGLCRPCRTAHSSESDKSPTPPTEAADVRARMTNLRDLLKSV
ncbi:MarR family transcriptional regulator [Streptomyces sp. TRM75563]|uniref:MarR family transcriptional regulator n=1 Tax=Streptomyces sp. TRM75563 TaxID=2817418 RepID=UPI001F6071A1|nr:MarR family transcriptional regulator [Streptomyces sp. TRM75563]MCI4041825.1 MarR family transcriptional regulator [Streptomyces sp. TRM75563]